MIGKKSNLRRCSRNPRLGSDYCTQHSGGPAEDSDPLVLADPGACLNCGFQTYRADALCWVCRAGGPQQLSLDDVVVMDHYDNGRAAAGRVQ